jgi:hypothetical protein
VAGSKRLIRGKETWQLRVYVGRDSNGRVRHVHRTFQGSERAADRELAKLITAQELTPAPVSEAPTEWGPTTTINYAIEAWKANGWEDLSPKTTLGYQSTWKCHVKESIGSKRIAVVNTCDRDGEAGSK